MRIEPATDAHVPAMTAVLTDVHGVAGDGTGPRSALADGNTARQAVASALGTASRLVAIEGGEVVGFLLEPLPNVPGPETARFSRAHHDVRPDHVRPAYRRLYEVVWASLVAAGCTHHSLPVLAASATALWTLFELGSGAGHRAHAVPLPGADVPSSAARRAEHRADLHRSMADPRSTVLVADDGTTSWPCCRRSRTACTRRAC